MGTEKKNLNQKDFPSINKAELKKPRTIKVIAMNALFKKTMGAAGMY